MNIIDLCLRVICAAVVWFAAFFAGRVYQVSDIYIFGGDTRVMFGFSIAVSVILALLMALL